MIFFDKKEKSRRVPNKHKPFNDFYETHLDVMVPYVEGETAGNEVLTADQIKVIHEETDDYMIQRFGNTANYSLRLRSFPSTWDMIAEQVKNSVEESKSGIVDFRVVCHWGPKSSEIKELRVRIKVSVKGLDPLKVKIKFSSGDLESSALGKALNRGYKESVSVRPGFM